MAKFCAACGAQAHDDAMICGYCGAEFPKVQTSGTAGKMNFDAGAVVNKVSEGITDTVEGVRKKDKGSIIKLAAVGAAVLVVAVIILTSIFSGGPKSTVKDFAKAFKSFNENKIVKLMPSWQFDYYEDMNGMDKSEYKERLEETFDDLKDDGIKITDYKIIDEYVYDEEGVESFAESFEWLYDDYGFKSSKLKKVVEYEVEFTFKRDGEKQTGSEYITVIKYGGKWYLTTNIL